MDLSKDSSCPEGNLCLLFCVLESIFIFQYFYLIICKVSKKKFVFCAPTVLQLVQQMASQLELSVQMYMRCFISIASQNIKSLAAAMLGPFISMAPFMQRWKGEGWFAVNWKNITIFQGHPLYIFTLHFVFMIYGVNFCLSVVANVDMRKREK